MLKEFLQFISKEKLCSPKTTVLITVSGGVDSVVMSHLFHRAGFSFAIAHCNFGLRGRESDEDEHFVKKLAESFKVAFFKKTFHTASYAKRKKISVQMAARELRYEWINRLASEKGFELIATAHHQDDSIETFFINLLRGTGIAGLQGVPVRQGKIIRPMLFANKKMIRDYAEENGLKWREDSSNQTDKYLRNSIRHHVVPTLKKLNTGFEKTIGRELSYFKDAAEIFKKFIEEKKNEIVTEKGGRVILNIRKLKESGYAETVLHELLRAYDFTPETTELVAKQLYTTAGKKFLSPTYRLIKDREHLILTRHPEKKRGASVQLQRSNATVEWEGLRIETEILTGGLEVVRDKTGHTAYLDLDSLVFPLLLRRWKAGDSFQPLGMKGKKKLSDFLVDNKVSVPEKEDTWVLESGGEIAWVVNWRLDDRFKISKKTKSVFRVASV